MLITKWLLTVWSIFASSSAIRLTCNVIDMGLSVDPEFGSSSCMPENVVEESQAVSNSFRCNLTIITEISCDLKVNWELTLLDKFLLADVVATKDEDTVYNILQKAKGTFFESFLDGFMKCLNLQVLCPAIGIIKFKKCKIVFDLDAPPIANQWKVSWNLFSKDGKMVFAGHMVVQIDDTESIREKRPTAGQRRRRKP